MSVTGQNALFDRPRSLRVSLQPLLIMIGLNDESVDFADTLPGKFRGIAEIGEKSDRTVIAGQDKRDRIDRIMRHVKCLDVDILNRKGRTGGEDLITVGLCESPSAEVFRGERVTINRHVKFSAEDFQAGDMITVLVREQDAIE